MAWRLRPAHTQYDRACPSAFIGGFQLALSVSRERKTAIANECRCSDLAQQRGSRDNLDARRCRINRRRPEAFARNRRPDCCVKQTTPRRSTARRGPAVPPRDAPAFAASSAPDAVPDRPERSKTRRPTFRFANLRRRATTGRRFPTLSDNPAADFVVRHPSQPRTGEHLIGDLAMLPLAVRQAALEFAVLDHHLAAQYRHTRPGFHLTAFP